MNPINREAAMSLNEELTVARRAPGADHERMAQYEATLEVSTGKPDLSAAAPQFNPWRQETIKVLNDSLATELVCVLRYKRHHFIADSLAMPKIAEEFLGFANKEAAHADQLAQRIVELGGKPDFAPNLQAMVRADQIVERVVVESYGPILKLIVDQDATTRHLPQDIPNYEQEHVEEPQDWLID
jgi:bacterioferritin